MRSLRTVVAILAGLAPLGGATRLKELVSLEGVRENQLIGYGLVVGLAGTGDRRQTVFSAQSLTNLLERMGVSVAPEAIRVNNTAAVMVTAVLPPFARPGTKIDVTVAAIGDASNLQGGLLLLTSLRGADGQVYAVAQGPVVTGGFVAGRLGTSQTVNHPTVGRVPNGATVERPAPTAEPTGHVKLQLRQADFSTAVRIAAAVNRKFASEGEPAARADNAAVVSVRVPEAFIGRAAEFIAELERLTVETDRPAKVVVNERTGTIVMGKEVRISPVAILHGNLTVEIQTAFAVSQPPPLSPGTTQVVPQVGVGIKEDKARNVVLKEGATVEELVRALTSVGSTPRDIIAILENLRAAGALEAELEVI
ncbi:MAG: flagellar basal body P-ring protein FlgI [Bryobacterales bacterium]|nr:flagellar basal body P-ring protein FlgI [Bryobacteraceae bacterium]MDW8131986.1 flagellar basal body P-ring protein FlgI [Bryobacterales bacterium]MDW8355270.1 flagellar basal body P-ring protein FlgI [Bryobacterales bacterium]